MFIVFMCCTDIEVLCFSTRERTQRAETQRETESCAMRLSVVRVRALERARDCVRRESARTQMLALPSLDTLFAATVLSDSRHGKTPIWRRPIFTFSPLFTQLFLLLLRQTVPKRTIPPKIEHMQLGSAVARAWREQARACFESPSSIAPCAGGCLSGALRHAFCS